MLQDYDTPLDTAGVTEMIIRSTVVLPEPEIRVTTEVDPPAYDGPIDAHAGFVGKPDEFWSWSDLRDYVVREIQSRFGPFPRNPKTEASIFKSFLGRHEGHAPAIARFAFESHDGYWCGAPISVNRFCKASDAYFAAVILASLAERQPT